MRPLFQVLSLFLATFTLFFGLKLEALELQTLVGSDCQISSGLIVHVDETHLDLMSLSGRHEIWPIAKIDSILIYNVLHNPFSRMTVDASSIETLKELYLEDTDEPTAVAWPVKFIDDLVVYFSLDGQTHVHTLEDLYRIRPARKGYLGAKAISNSRAVELALSDGTSKCSRTSDGKRGFRPTRVLADKIRVSNYLESFQLGYETLEGFQERTYLYARPYLYDRKSRLGFVIRSQGRDEPTVDFPLYFQWSKGKPYRFQSQSVFGSKSHEFLPNTEPVFAFRSDVKSHVFNALFIGNVTGMSAGSSVILNSSSLEMKQALTVAPSFNYLAMMGGDYGPYSLSFGFFYPSFGLRVQDEQREILGSQLSYAFRAMFTKRNYRLRAILAWINFDRGQPSSSDLVVTSNGVQGPLPNKFHFESAFVRGGLDYDFSSALHASLDLITVAGKYSETDTSFTNRIDFSRITPQLSVTQSFSDYVSLAAYVNFNQFVYHSNFLGVAKNHEQRETKFFGTFEFVF